MKGFFNRIGQSIEELILISIIILNVFDFAEKLNPDFDYIKKIISWTALGYLVYKADLTRIFFGETHNGWNIALIMSYFMLSFKNILGYASSTMVHLSEMGAGYWATLYKIDAVPKDSTIVNIISPIKNVDLNLMSDTYIGEGLGPLVHNLTIVSAPVPGPNSLVVNISNDISSRLFLLEPNFIIHRWLNFIVQHQSTLQKATLVIGALMLILMAIYFALRFNIREPSLMHVLHEEGPPARFNDIGRFTVRLLTILFILNFFFIVIFNLMMEWLAIAVDAPLLIMGVLFYILLWIKHHKRFSPESMVYRLGNLGSGFYQNFIRLFYSKRGLLLAISGMLVLHLLTDVGIFLIPYSLGLIDPLYFDQLGPNHEPIFSISGLFGDSYSHLGHDLQTGGLLQQAAVIYAYAGNIIAMLLLLVMPAALWYLMFSRTQAKVPTWLPAVFTSSFICLVLSPAFEMRKVSSQYLAGVDILTRSIVETSIFPTTAVMTVSIAAGIIVLFISVIDSVKEKMVYAVSLVSVAYFAYYIYLFFMDIGQYYIHGIGENIQSGEAFISGYFIIFFTMTIIFYVGGFIIYLYELADS